MRPADALFRLVGQSDRGTVGHLPRPLHGTCESAGGATWLQITARAGDTRPVVTPTLGPTWGLHLDDVNLALGNLVNDVAAEETAYSHHHTDGLTRSRSGRRATGHPRRAGYSFPTLLGSSHCRARTTAAPRPVG